MDGEGEFHLEEFDEAGKSTRKFAGRFVTPDWIEGTWSSAGGRKEMPFSAWSVSGEQIPASGPADTMSGRYQRMIRGRVDKNSATLNIWLLKDGRVRVQGDALWIGNPKTGSVHDGEVDGVFPVKTGKVFYRDSEQSDSCSFTMAFANGSLTVSDDTMNCGGLNVTFEGTYRKVGPPKTP